MSARHLWGILAIALSAAGCAKSDRVAAPQPFDPMTLANTEFNVVAKNESESVILLGQLRFGSIAGSDVAGSWQLSQWSGDDIPGLPGEGSIRGTLHGESAILDLDLPGNEASLGIILDHSVEGRVAGTITLLPSGAFRGTCEAIAVK